MCVRQMLRILLRGAFKFVWGCFGFWLAFYEVGQTSGAKFADGDAKIIVLSIPLLAAVIVLSTEWLDRRNRGARS